ncbi:MAG: methylenetetrahydrofolate reductase [Alphaproteobacteria bacterium]|nr:methylenetetrahydrofolate reductase [Alphaproteobacteria bacterium]
MNMSHPAAEASAREVAPSSRLEEVLSAGRFAVTAEMASPDSSNPEDVLANIAPLVGHVDAINVTDGSGANAHIASLAASAIIARAGHTPVMQMTCRDRNRIAIQADLVGAAALGINTLLCLGGDDVKAGDHPDAKPVFDLDGTSLIKAARTLCDGQYLSGRKLTHPPRLFIGAPENPFMAPLEGRLEKLKARIEVGAQFVQTQFCFDIALLRQFMTRAVELGLDRRCSILVGVGPLASARTARWMRSNIPGVHIPDATIERMETSADPAAEGRRICVEMMQQIREVKGVAGVHIMAIRQERWIGELVQSSGVLGGRRAGAA